MLPDSPAMMGDVQARSGLPVATGERFSSIFQFQELLANNGCAYVRPDVCLCMGLTGAKKVAAMAEAHHVKVIPHNPLSPISTAACVQLTLASRTSRCRTYGELIRPSATWSCSHWC